MWNAAAVLIPALVFLGVIVMRYDGKPYLRGDCQYYFYTAESVWFDHDLDLANQLPPPLQRHSKDVALDLEGRLVPKHPVWLSLAALPMIAALGGPGGLLFNYLQLVLLLFLTVRYACRFATPVAASAAVILTALTTLLPHYVWNFSPDVFATTLLLAGLNALPADSEPARTRHVAAGVLIGLAAIAKFSFILALPGILLICGRPLRRSLPFFAAGVAVPFLLWAALNTHLFGSPLVTSYDRMAVVEDGTISLHTQRSDFDLPLWTGVRDQLVDAKHGLLLTSPVTLVSMLGFGLLVRRSRNDALYLITYSLALFLFFSKYQLWNTSHHGNRFLMPIIILAAVPLAALIDALVSRLKKTRGEALSGPPPVGEQ